VASAPALVIPDSGRGARRSQGGGSQANLAFLRAAVTQEPFWADLQPRVALVERGGSLWLNCSTNCPRPERGGLETSLRRNGTQKGLRWLARQLVDIREPETQPVCFFRCARRTLQARGLIRTFREFSAATLLTPLLSLPSRSRSLGQGVLFFRPHSLNPHPLPFLVPGVRSQVLLSQAFPTAVVPPPCRTARSCGAGAAASLAASGRELHPEL